MRASVKRIFIRASFPEGRRRGASATMDQELAKRLFEEGAVLVLLDVPERTEFGIDYNCWSVGPKFKGLKMIPPGLHLVYYW